MRDNDSDWPVMTAMLVILVAVGLLLAFPVKWALNYLLAPGAIQAVFGSPQIGYWKAYILYLTLAILVKGGGK